MVSLRCCQPRRELCEIAFRHYIRRYKHCEVCVRTAHFITHLAKAGPRERAEAKFRHSFARLTSKLEPASLFPPLPAYRRILHLCRKSMILKLKNSADDQLADDPAGDTPRPS